MNSPQKVTTCLRGAGAETEGRGEQTARLHLLSQLQASNSFLLEIPRVASASPTAHLINKISFFKSREVWRIPGESDFLCKVRTVPTLETHHPGWPLQYPRYSSQAGWEARVPSPRATGSQEGHLAETGLLGRVTGWPGRRGEQSCWGECQGTQNAWVSVGAAGAPPAQFRHLASDPGESAPREATQVTRGGPSVWGLAEQPPWCQARPPAAKAEAPADGNWGGA